MKSDLLEHLGEAGSTARRDLLAVYAAALCRVDGRAAVRRHLTGRPVGEMALVAVGKAAEAMALGALDALGDAIAAGLVVTKHRYAGLSLPPRVRVMEAGHPVPDAASLAAGEALLRFLEAQPASRRLLFLLSGGASSLVEAPRPGITLDLLQRTNAWLLASGLPIDAVNAVRRRLSLIKGGGLLRWVGDREASCLLISDVPGDDPRVIGSGPLVPPSLAELPAGLPDWLAGAGAEGVPAVDAGNCEIAIVARLDDALAAVAAEGARLGYRVHRHPEFLSGDAAEAGLRIGALLLDAPAGLHLWGGETTLTLPPARGRGGRSQHLALAAATVIADRDDIALLAGATDGSDGPGEDAGGLVDGETVARGALDGLDPQACLRRADSGTFLEAAGDLIQTGPTGTNVMDLVIALRGSARVDGEGATSNAAILARSR